MPMTSAQSNGKGSAEAFDVIIVGGGPAGTTAASLLRKYNPELRVMVLEKEVFPRDHIGESQLPAIGPVLHEMGVWDAVEAAGFPIKLGGSYTWGRDADQWDFDFYPVEKFMDEPRPAKYEGQRRYTAFQVDRALYDDILLKHAARLGAHTREGAQVRDVGVEGDRITHVTLESGEVLTARHYIDASGNVGVLRRALGIGVDVTEELKNVAIWDYWQNTEWGEYIGVGGTRIQIRSLPYGWIWFIPLGPTRTSVGLVIPAEHLKRLGLSNEQVYLKGLADQPQIAGLLAKGTREMKLTATKDWSQLCDRLSGENWLLVGEAAGFADPILSAGMSLAHSSARDAAYTILELDRGEHDAKWLRERFNERHRTNIRQHIRFGQYWYSGNGCFTELQEHCSRIAAEAGLTIDPKRAWQWLAQGGFTSENPGLPTLGAFDVNSARHVLQRFDRTGKDKPIGSLVSGHNVFRLNLRGAKRGKIGFLENGRIEAVDCWERGDAKLPLVGAYGVVASVLERLSDGVAVTEELQRIARRHAASDAGSATEYSLLIQALDVLIEQYWVTRAVERKRPVIDVVDGGGSSIRTRDRFLSDLERSGATNVKINYE